MTSRSSRNSRPGRPTRGAAKKSTRARRESPQQLKTRRESPQSLKVRKESPQLPKGRSSAARAAKNASAAPKRPAQPRQGRKLAVKNAASAAPKKRVVQRAASPQRSASAQRPGPKRSILRKKPAQQVVVRSDSSETLESTIARAVKSGGDKRRSSWRRVSAAAARRASQRPGKASRRPGTGMSDSAAQRRPEKPAVRAAEETPEPATERRTIVWHGKERSHSIPVQWAAFVLVVLLAGVIVLNPVSQYVAQQQEKRAALASLEETKTRVDALEKSLAKWQDDAFVKSQARERLGYVMPGETLYMVSDPNRGSAKDQLDKRTAEVTRKMREATPFYLTVWDSVTIAGEAKVTGEDVENPSKVPLLNDPSDSSDSDGSSNSGDNPASENGGASG